MPVLLYCVFSPNLSLPEIATGVQEAPVQRLDHAGVSALYSETAALPQDPGELAQAAMSFQSTVQQVFGAGVVIPFGFPTLLAGSEELRAHLDANASRYATGLKRLNGMAQMEVRLTRPLGTGKSAEPPDNGTASLKPRLSESISIDSAFGELRQSAGPLVHEWHSRESADATRCYALIPHDKAAEFKRLIGFVRLAGGTRTVVSGPWPPSEFLPPEK